MTVHGQEKIALRVLGKSVPNAIGQSDEAPEVGVSRQPVHHFAFVQALRGIAALWVVLFHISTLPTVSIALDRYGWVPMTFLFRNGRGGVAVFFVLSGFVIAHSLWQRPMTGRNVLSFAVRRSLRLDPPYWTALALTVSIAVLQAKRHGFPPELPDLPTVVAHLLYLQELLRVPEIGMVFWTLTYEIQFYLIAATGCFLWHRLSRRHVERRRLIRRGLTWPMIALAFVAAAVPFDWWPHGLFTTYWHGFACGAMAYAAGVRARPIVPVLLLCGVMLVSAPATQEIFDTPAALTALLLLAVSRAGWLGGLLSSRCWQGLGTISYSLYLVHVPMLLVVNALLGMQVRPLAVVLPAYTFACIAGGALFWWAIERPAHHFARHFGRRGVATRQDQNTATST